MTDFSFRDEDIEIDPADLMYPSQMGTNSVTLPAGVFCLFRIGGELSDGEPYEHVHVLDLDRMASIISILCEQAVRDGMGPQLLRLIATDLMALKDAKSKLN